MKNKKVIIFLLLVLGAAGVLRACFHSENPRAVTAVRREVQAAAGEREVRESDKIAAARREIRESDKIAVVNLDEGTRRDGRQINYAQELSRFPTMDFEYASLEAARTGLEAGRYGAYVIIPADFSQNVKSINTAPQVSQLEYAVNKSYSGEGQYKLLYNVQSYIDSLDNRLSYMYVDNILKEFHEAQDGADRVMENDLRDQEAIEKIEARELVTLVEAPEYQMEENAPKELDITDYVKRNGMLTDAMNAEYTRNVQNIQSEAASLSTDGMALAERLKALSSNVPEVDLTVDESGQSITEKADSQLRAELERQSGSMLDKEKIACYLNGLLENNQKMREYIKQIGGQPVEPPKQPEEPTEQPKEPPSRPEEEGGAFPGELGEVPNQPEEGKESPGQLGEVPDQSEEIPEQPDEWQQSGEKLLTWLEEEDMELCNMIGEVQSAKGLDSESICELARSGYAEPMILRAGEARREYMQRHEEEIAAIAAYNGRLAGFGPQTDDQFILENISKMTENYGLLQENLLANNSAYAEYAKKTADSVREYADGLQKQVKEAQVKSEEKITEGLSEAQETKKETSFANRKILAEFVSKLPYTRIGKAEYTQVYRFVANPVEAEDCSEGQKQDESSDDTGSVIRNQTQNPVMERKESGTAGKKKTRNPAVYVLSGGFIVVLAVQVYFIISRRKREYEY